MSSLLLHELVGMLAFLARAAWAVRIPPLADGLTVFLRLLRASVPVVCTVVFFGGAMITVQAAASLAPFGAAELAGLVVGFGGVREVFPLLAAACVAARSGAEFASHVAAMRITQQIDALEVMGLDPMRIVVAPRVLAAVLGTPVCVVVGCCTGMWGAQLIGAWQLGIDAGAMWMRLWSAVSIVDLEVGAFKGAVLGFVLAGVSLREGMGAVGGPAGVGRATNRAVVRSMIAVCLASLVLTSAIYGSTVS